MASRKIDGTKHIRRKLRTRAKIAISVAVLAAVSLGGLFFINTTDKGAEVKEKISQMSIVSGTHEAEQSYGGGSTPVTNVDSIIKISMGSEWFSDDDPKKVQKGGGYVYGGGTLRTGEKLTLYAKPYDGYTFDGWVCYNLRLNWYIPLLEETDSITISNGDVEGADEVFHENVEIIARFQKKAPSDYTYNFSISPAVGNMEYINYEELNDSKKFGAKDNINASDYTFKDSKCQKIDRIDWSLTYSELERNFSYEMETHTSMGKDSSDSYTSRKTYSVEYDIYGFYENGEIFSEAHDLSVKVAMSPDDTDKKIIKIPVDGRQNTSKGNVYYYVIVPHTLAGGKYQAITIADPKEGGTTNGDRVSTTPFSTTLSAVAAKGYKFDRWTWNDPTPMESKEKSTSVTPNGTVLYTAHFVTETYNIDVESISPEVGGSIHGLGDYMSHTNIPITIFPSDGYKLDSWTYTTSDGDSYSGNSESFLIKDLSSDVKISVKFTSTKARIDVKASPVDGGTVTIENTTSGNGKIKTDYEEFIVGKENAELVARPADTDGDGTPDYKVLYWKDSKGNIYNGEKQGDESNVLTLNNVASSDTFTAYFAPSKITIKTNVYPDNTAGSVKVTGATQADPGDPSKGYTAAPNTSVTLNANEATGYHFLKFVDDGGKEYQSNPLVKSDLVTDTTFTAIFVPDEFEIKAVATPVTGGTVTVNNRAGSNTVSYNDNVKIEAKANENYIFKYFEDQNGAKYGGTVSSDKKTASFTFKAVNGPETYKAVFGMSEVSLSVTVDPKNLDETDPAKYKAGGFKIDYTDVDGNPVNVPETFADWTTDGTTDDTPNKKIKGQTSVKITAVPGDGYRFSKFVDTDGNIYTENPLVYPDLSENKEVEIIFVPEKFDIRVEATPIIGGKASVAVNDGAPREGSNTVSYADKVTLTATPTTDKYSFMYFEDHNGKKFKGTETPVGSGIYQFTFDAVNGPETYKAVFAMSSVSVSVKVDPSMKDTEAGHTDEYLAGGYSVSYTSAEPTDPSNPNVETGALYTASTIPKIKGQTSVKITAIPKSGYRFSKFIDDEGNTWTENILVLGDLVENKNIEIIYVPEKFDIKAQASPSTGGKVKIKVNHNGTITEREGSNTASYNDEVTLTATPEYGYVFRYFEDANGNQYKQDVDPGTGVATFTFKAVNGAESYKAVFGMRSVRYNIDVFPKDKDSDDKYYIAGGYEITYVDNANGQEYIVEKYEEGSFGQIRSEKGVKIRALEQNGYHFVRFVDSKGQSYTENPLVRPDIVESDNITIIFEEDDLTVNVVVSPDKGGTATANGKAGTTKVKYGEWVNINAKPNPGYMFRYFEDQDGNHYEGVENADGSNTYSFKAVNASTTFKAIFVQQKLSLEMIYDPVDTTKCGVVVTYQSPHGELNVTDPFRNQINDIVGMTDIKIKAVEKSGYKFLKFVDGTGRVYNDNPLVLPSVTENQKIIAIFVEENWRIETKSSPETGGRVTINDIEGGLDVNYGQHVKIEAKPNTGYKFLYFKDSNGSEYMSNPLEFDVINGSETYTAYFAKNDVNITIDLAPAGAGTVRFNSEPAVSGEKTYPTNGASSVTLTATPKDDYKFLYWKDQDGNTYPDNPLVVVNISTDLKFTAVFESKYDTIRAVASPASGGKITKIINDDGSVTLIATANRGYKFTSWKKPDGRTYAFKFTIPADQVHTGDTYTAYFKIIPGYDMKSDITKEKFYREWRKVITPNYTVTRDYMQLLAMQSVAGLRQYDDATPGLKSYRAYGDAKAYFDSKTGDAVKRLDVVFGDAELITAESEVLTPDLLPDADNYLAAAEKFTDKKFGDRYVTEILTVKRVLEPDDFNAKKRTYLWRYTGAEYKDNIYLLYDMSDSKPKYVTPIVDEDGVLKFTIDKLENNDVVAVVRVKIK